ncbi:fungal-specific transcription factor domain-containing protein [Aspergillus cavernicola]|uniref:Fungal-specific transcription factor domain-containing protein n=1 Tax=Aspergillus cavernicola TaxID=176166 RepID=A0ABR4HKZ0_9EURO
MLGLVHKACDRCRSRKVRCISPSESGCEHCQSRDLPCHFSHQKRRKRRNNELIQVPNRPTPPAPTPGANAPQHPIPLSHSYSAEGNIDRYPDLYIDYLLEQGHSYQTCCPNSSHDQLTTLLGPSPNISFFSANRVQAISQQLGHNRLEPLLEAIRTAIASRLKSSSPLVPSGVDKDASNDTEAVHNLAGGSTVKDHINTYMELVHPFYPFLCRSDFEQRAFAPGLVQDLVANKSWACLYYGVVAVGCQHNGGGAYEARTGESWAYFERSMTYFQDLIFPKRLVTSVQALMSLAIFCQSISAFGLELLMIAEAAVMAQSLGINRGTSALETSSARTFWVLYYMEKTSCFTAGKVPTLQDSYISCPFPNMSEWAFSDYDWFLSFAKYSRLISKINSRLLTITSIPKPWVACNITIQSLRSELETWRDSIPRRFRPGEPLRPRMLSESRALSVALRTQYYYYHAYLTLTWTLLHCGTDRPDFDQEQELKTELMQAARSVLELTSYIEISPSTPVWMLALMPLSALMILFDLVIHNPSHPETSLNLALLDIASGHFSRMEYSSEGVLPGSLISEFAHLARQYISDIRHTTGHGHPNRPSNFRSTSFGHVAQQTQPRLSEAQPLHDDVPFGPMATFVPEETNAPSNPPLHQGINSFAPIEQDAAAASSSLSQMVPVTGEQNQIFFPQVEEQIDQLQYLGVDLMGLFDPTYPFIGYNAPVQDPYQTL